MNLGGQMSKNVHDVRKVFFETTLCILVCFIEFSCSFFMKLMWDVLTLYTNILGFEMCGKISLWITQGSLRKEPTCSQKDVKISLTYSLQSTPVGSRCPVGGGRSVTFRMVDFSSFVKRVAHTTDQKDGPLVGLRGVDGQA